MKKRIVTVASVVIVLLVAVGLFIADKNGWLFRVEDSVARALAKAELETCDIETRIVDVDELQRDGRVTFDQSGMLVNMEYQLQTGFEADVREYKDTGVLMNAAMIADYAELSAYVTEAFGEKLFVMSSYRTDEEQAQVVAEESENAIAVGASEHQTGLALDVYVRFYAGMGFIKSDVGQWINGECWRYGFIIRYPYYAKNVDGIGYEPWHIRYVGKPHAEIMYKNSLTLEEYYGSLDSGVWYEFDGYHISRQSGEQLSMPVGYDSAVISPDNAGGYIITVH